MGGGPFDRVRLDEAALSPAQADIVREFLAHNLNNAMAVLQLEMEMADMKARGVRPEVVDEVLARVAWTIEAVGVRAEAGTRGGGDAGTGGGTGTMGRDAR